MGPCSLVSLASRLAENQLWCQRQRQMLTHLLGKRYCEWKCCMCSSQSVSIGLDLAFFTLCPVRRIGPGVKDIQNTTQAISYYAWASDFNLPSQFYQAAGREVIRHGKERKDSSSAEMFLAFYSPPNIPRHARSFDVF